MPPYIWSFVSQKRSLVCQPTLQVSAKFTALMASLYSSVKLLSFTFARIGRGIVEMHQSAMISSPLPLLPDGRCITLTFGVPPLGDVVDAGQLASVSDAVAVADDRR